MGIKHTEHRRTMSFDQTMEYEKKSVVVKSEDRNGSVVDDWVDLVLFIDLLEDNADISICEGEELRQLAMNQMEKLLIVYKCYHRKQSRFVRYARGILKNEAMEREKKALIEKERKEKRRMSVESIQPMSASSEKDESSENYENANIVEEDMICID